MLTDLPPRSTTVEIRACRDVWAVLEQPGVQSLFVKQERAVDHAKQMLRETPGRIEIRDEDDRLLATFEISDTGSGALACA